MYYEDEQLIADTKWKIIKMKRQPTNVENEFYAYGTKYIDCKKLYLLYPYDNHGTLIYDIYIKKKKAQVVLNVLFFDLSQDESIFYKQNEIESKYKIIFEKIMNNIY